MLQEPLYYFILLHDRCAAGITLYPEINWHVSLALHFKHLFSRGLSDITVVQLAKLLRRVQHTGSTQPCIPPGSLNRVPASAGVMAGMSPLPGGR